MGHVRWWHVNFFCKISDRKQNRTNVATRPRRPLSPGTVGKSYNNRQPAAPRGPYEDRRRSFVVHTMCARVLSARDRRRRRRSVYKPDSVWGAPKQSIVELSFSSFPPPPQSFSRPSPSGPRREKAGNILKSIINLLTYPRRVFNNVYWVKFFTVEKTFFPLLVNRKSRGLFFQYSFTFGYPFPNYKSTARGIFRNPVKPICLLDFLIRIPYSIPGSGRIALTSTSRRCNRSVPTLYRFAVPQTRNRIVFTSVKREKKGHKRRTRSRYEMCTIFSGINVEWWIGKIRFSRQSVGSAVRRVHTEVRRYCVCTRVRHIYVHTPM